MNCSAQAKLLVMCNMRNPKTNVNPLIILHYEVNIHCQTKCATPEPEEQVLKAAEGV